MFAVQVARPQAILYAQTVAFYTQGTHNDKLSYTYTMPELPEVETVVRSLRAPLIGRTITGVWTDWPKVMRSPSPAEFAARLPGQTFRALNRRAKYIVCQLDHDVLAVHLKMTGRLYIWDNPEPPDRWVHFRLALNDSRYLCFSDARRFGRVYLAQDIEEIAPDLGPEPLDAAFTAAVLRQQLAGRHKAIKALLLDQSFIAGVGNIYADEALHAAGIHPLRPAHTLTDAEIARLHQAIRRALEQGIAHEGASINWYRKPDGERGESQDYLTVYGRDGQPCLTCGAPLIKIRVAQRGTHYCPICQPEP